VPTDWWRATVVSTQEWDLQPQKDSIRRLWHLRSHSSPADRPSRYETLAVSAYRSLTAPNFGTWAQSGSESPFRPPPFPVAFTPPGCTATDRLTPSRGSGRLRPVLVAHAVCGCCGRGYAPAVPPPIMRPCEMTHRPWLLRIYFDPAWHQRTRPWMSNHSLGRKYFPMPIACLGMGEKSSGARTGSGMMRLTHW
jgi:hypothetical protein